MVKVYRFVKFCHKTALPPNVAIIVGTQVFVIYFRFLNIFIGIPSLLAFICLLQKLFYFLEELVCSSQPLPSEENHN
jgi:hypothetical protein